VNTKKIVFKQFLEISDFYLMSLLGNYLYIFGHTKKSEILKTIAVKSKFDKIDFKDFMYILHDNIEQYHVHDPQIYKSFNIVVRYRYSLEELKEIYESVIKLEKKNLGARFDGLRNLKRFIGFLYILDLGPIEIQKFLSDLVDIDCDALWYIILEMKPEKNIYYPTFNRIMKKIIRITSNFSSEERHDKRDKQKKKQKNLIYNF
jgi:hypothetical protein